MLREIRPAIVVLVALTLITGLGYPLAMTGIAQIVFPKSGAGEPNRARRQGRRFRAHWPRVCQRQVLPWATVSYYRARSQGLTKTVAAPYNAANSGGSNLGPSNKALIDRVQSDLDKLRGESPPAPVPIDLVTTSASGLDPDISPQAAYFQVPRVAKARNLAENQLRQLVSDHIADRFLGLLGEPRVNVLLLNLALDRLSAG